MNDQTILMLEKLIASGGKLNITDSKGTQYAIEHNGTYFLLVYQLDKHLCHINFMRLDDAIRHVSGAAGK